MAKTPLIVTIVVDGGAADNSPGHDKKIRAQLLAVCGVRP